MYTARLEPKRETWQTCLLTTAPQRRRCRIIKVLYLTWVNEKKAKDRKYMGKLCQNASRFGWFASTDPTYMIHPTVCSIPYSSASVSIIKVNSLFLQKRSELLHLKKQTLSEFETEYDIFRMQCRARRLLLVASLSKALHDDCLCLVAWTKQQIYENQTSARKLEIKRQPESLESNVNRKAWNTVNF